MASRCRGCWRPALSQHTVVCVRSSVAGACYSPLQLLLANQDSRFCVLGIAEAALPPTAQVAGGSCLQSVVVAAVSQQRVGFASLCYSADNTTVRLNEQAAAQRCRAEQHNTAHHGKLKRRQFARLAVLLLPINSAVREKQRNAYHRRFAVYKRERKKEAKLLQTKLKSQQHKNNINTTIYLI